MAGLHSIKKLFQHEAFKIALTYFVISKALFLCAALVSWWMLPQALHEPARVDVNSGWLMAVHWRWDAIHYYTIATRGYDPPGLTAFFPLFPLSMEIGSFVLGGFHVPQPYTIAHAERAPLLAGILISNGAFLLALIYAYALVFQEWADSALAQRTVKYIAFFPLAFYYQVPYTESIFLLALIALFYYARQEKLILAGACGALLTAARPTGLVIIPVFLLECYWYYRRRGYTPRLLLAALLPSLGIGSYMLFCWYRFNDPLMFIHAQQQSDWARSNVWPWEALGNGLYYAFNPQLSKTPDLYARGFLHTVIILGTLIITFSQIRHWRISYLALSLGILGLILVSPFPDELVMHGLGRYTMVIFPLYITLARWSQQRPWLENGITAVWIGLYCLFSALYVGWYPVA